MILPDDATPNPEFGMRVNESAVPSVNSCFSR
jgi:hypothetical protein